MDVPDFLFMDVPDFASVMFRLKKSRPAETSEVFMLEVL